MKRLIVMYLVAIVSANLILAHFQNSVGPWLSVGTAFAFIGLDLTSRDLLHEHWRGRSLVWKMGLLIAAGSGISWLMNHDAEAIAIASFVAFAATGAVDTGIYAILGKRSQLLRINGSNILASAVDSTLFPTLAFGALMPHIVAAQFGAKVIGGFLWSFILRVRHDDNASKQHVRLDSLSGREIP